MRKGITVNNPGLELGGLRTFRVNQTDLPTLLPPGCKCQILAVTPDRLKTGDVVATSTGNFRRFWSTDGRNVWVTDESGLLHETHPISNGLVQKVIVEPLLWRNLIWFWGALVGRLRRSEKGQGGSL